MLLFCFIVLLFILHTDLHKHSIRWLRKAERDSLVPHCTALHYCNCTKLIFLLLVFWLFYILRVVRIKDQLWWCWVHIDFIWRERWRDALGTVWKCVRTSENVFEHFLVTCEANQSINQSIIQWIDSILGIHLRLINQSIDFILELKYRNVRYLQ